MDRVRAERSRRDRDQHDQEVPDATHVCVAKEVEYRHEGEALRRCLDSLTSAQRDAVAEAYYCGLTYREVARLLGTGLPTVKTRIRDGLDRLCDGLRFPRG